MVQIPLRQALCRLYNSSSKAAARAAFAEIAEAYGTKAAKAVDLPEEGLDFTTQAGDPKLSERRVSAGPDGGLCW